MPEKTLVGDFVCTIVCFADSFMRWNEQGRGRAEEEEQHDHMYRIWYTALRTINVNNLAQLATLCVRVCPFPWAHLHLIVPDRCCWPDGGQRTTGEANQKR